MIMVTLNNRQGVFDTLIHFPSLIIRYQIAQIMRHEIFSLFERDLLLFWRALGQKTLNSLGHEQSFDELQLAYGEPFAHQFIWF